MEQNARRHSPGRRKHRTPRAVAEWHQEIQTLGRFRMDVASQIERDVIERALTLDFLPKGRNLVLVGRTGWARP